MTEQLADGFFATQIAQNNYDEQHQQSQQQEPERKQETMDKVPDKMPPHLKTLLLAFNSYDQ